MSVRRQLPVGSATTGSPDRAPGSLSRPPPAAAAILLGCSTIVISRAIDQRLVHSRIERTTLEATLSDEIGWCSMRAASRSRASGQRPLIVHGLARALLGQTTVEDVLRTAAGGKEPRIQGSKDPKDQGSKTQSTRWFRGSLVPSLPVL
jgi:hypothetical protein